MRYICPTMNIDRVHSLYFSPQDLVAVIITTDMQVYLTSLEALEEIGSGVLEYCDIWDAIWNSRDDTYMECIQQYDGIVPFLKNKRHFSGNVFPKSPYHAGLRNLF